MNAGTVQGVNQAYSNKTTGSVKSESPGLKTNVVSEQDVNLPGDQLDLGSLYSDAEANLRTLTDSLSTAKVGPDSKLENLPAPYSGFLSGNVGLSSMIGLGVVAGAAFGAGAGFLGPAAIGMSLGGLGLGSLGMPSGLQSLKSLPEPQEQAQPARTRNADGRFRTKSGKTKLETLRGTYGLDFAAGLPGNMPLGILRAATGESLTQLLKNPDKIQAVKPELENWQAPELAPGGRTRNADGRIRAKSGNTKLETLRGTYGLDFAAGLPGNMPLQVLRATTGESLTQLLKNPEKIEVAKPQLENWSPGYPSNFDSPSVNRVNQMVLFPSTYDSPNIISSGIAESSSESPSASSEALKTDADATEYLIR